MRTNIRELMTWIVAIVILSVASPPLLLERVRKRTDIVKVSS